MSNPTPGKEPSGRTFPWGTVFAVAVLFLIALVARAFQYHAAFPDGRLSPFGADPFYHMRRVWMTIAHYPRISPFFDYYMAYPLGGVIIWPPLFDFTIATLAMIIGLGHPGVWLVEHVAAFLPALVGAATVIPLYFLAKHLFGRSCALLSCAVSAVLPASISISMVGRVDHHVLDVFMSTCFLLAMMKAVSGRRGMNWLAGLVLGLTFLTWHGASWFVVIVLCFYGVEILRCYHAREGAERLLSTVLPVLVLPLIFLLPYVRYSPWMDSAIVGSAPVETPPQPYMGLSRFHVGFVLLSILFVLYGYALAGRFRKEQLGRPLFGLLFLGLPLLISFILYASGSLDRLRSVLIYAGQKDPWLSTVAECQPLFFSVGKFDPSFAEVSFGYGLYIFPVAFLLVLLRLARGRTERGGLILFVVWSGATVCLILAKRRFVGEFAVCFSMTIAYLVVETARNIGGIPELRPGVRKAAWAAFVCVVLLLALPAVSYFIPLSARLYRQAPRFQTIPACYREAIDFLREKTAPTSHYDEPLKKPEYGVLAEWKCGEWIQCVGRRPVTANCMGTHLGRLRPFRDSARFLFLEGEEEAVNLLKRDEVRFVMTAYFVKNLLNYHKIAGVELLPYAAKRIVDSRVILSPREKYFRTMGSRLHERDGVMFPLPGSREVVPPLRHFRLIYEGSRDEEVKEVLNIPALKIFEVVEGAIVRGKAKPGVNVAAGVEVATNRSRVFRYVTVTRASDSGDFEFVVPYSTVGCPYRTRAATPYAISCGTSSLLLEVPESALDGQVVRCDLNEADVRR